LPTKSKLSDSELEIMKVIWSVDGPVTTAFLIKEFSDSRGWKSQTINTFLTRLMEKGMLKAEKKGVANCYTPMVSVNEYLGKETRAFLDELHHGSVSSFIAALGGSENLSDEDISALKAWLDKR